LEEDDKLDMDEMNAKLYDKFRHVNASIAANKRSHGYAKSPDYYHKFERVQRFTEKQWMKSRGRSKDDQPDFITMGEDVVRVKRQHMSFSQIPKADLTLLRDGDGTESDRLQDKVNNDILSFCT